MTITDRYRRLSQHKVNAYRWLYEFSQDQCSKCEETGCACKDSICQHVEEQALKKGVRFQHTGHSLRFIGCKGCKGCVVPPHLRETCTIYLCASALQNPLFQKVRYERLKNLCAVIDAKIMDVEEELK